MRNSGRFKLGLFTCFAFLLFIVILISLGMLDRFNEKAEVITFVDESIQGLSQGSGVKLQGVPIGTVSCITIEPETGLIEIEMEIDLSRMRKGIKSSDSAHQMTAPDFYAYADEMIVKKGLRCQLASEGITGMKYMALDFVKDPVDKEIMEPGFRESEIFYIPSVPSLIADLRTSAMSIIDKINAIDFEGISGKLVSTLNSADKVLNDPRLDNIFKNINDASSEIVSTIRQLNQSVTRERIDELVASSSKTIRSVEELSEFLRTELKQMELSKTADTARGTMESIHCSSDQFVRTMVKLNEGVDALVELIQMLDGDPSSLLRGKKIPDAPVRNGQKK